MTCKVALPIGHRDDDDNDNDDIGNDNDDNDNDNDNDDNGNDSEDNLHELLVASRRPKQPGVPRPRVRSVARSTAQERQGGAEQREDSNSTGKVTYTYRDGHSGC